MSNVQHLLPAQAREVPPFVWFSAVLSPPECDALIRIGESRALQPGQIGNGIANETVINPDYRQVLTCAISPEDAPWAYDRLLSRITIANGHFNYDLHGLYEQLVFLRYDYDPAHPGKYEWHQDIGGGMSSLRKLSTVTQLSQPIEYDDCRLRMFTNMDFDPGKIEQGDTVIFPSYTPHCVTPITRGRRYSLVSWVTGPALR